MINQKQLPNNQEAERSVIGGLLLCASDDLMAKTLAIVKPESFYNPAHAHIIKGIKELVDSNRPVDLITLDAHLTQKGKINELGGFAYLAELAKGTPVVGNLTHYAKIVRDEAIKRFALGKLQECENLLFENNRLDATERLEIITRYTQEITDYSKTGKTATGLRKASEFVEEWVSDYEKFVNNDPSVRGLSTGFESLDELLGGGLLVKQSLLVVGARPKMGKTSFLSGLIASCAIDSKKTALVFSLEMKGKDILERMFGQRARVNPKMLYNSYYHQDEKDICFTKISQAISELIKDDLLLIDDTPNVSISHIRNECRKIKRERGEIGMIAVDYLTLMKVDKAERNDLAFGSVTKELKNLAREMDCVVLLLTQLNRSLESRADKRPLPSDSRDTGQIEQECDYWIGLHREGVYNEEADQEIMEALLRSNRHGGTGKVYLEMKHGCIFDLDQEEGKKRSNKGKQEVNQKRRKGDF